MQQIETLYLPDSVKSRYQNGESQPLTQLDSLSRVNILVGANNSGKSRFMRLLAVENGFDFTSKDNNITELYENLINYIQIIVDNTNSNKNYLLTELKQPFNELSRSISSKINTKIKDKLKILDKLIIRSINSQNKPLYINNKKLDFDQDLERNKIYNAINQCSLCLSELENKINQDFTTSYYIPTLRGLRPLDSEYTDFYQNHTIDSYFKDAEHQPTVFTGLGLYNHCC